MRMSNTTLPSTNTNRFSSVPKANLPRSSFNRNHGYKTTFDSGFLIPIFVDEALPGDTFNTKMTAFARLQTPIVPFMDNLRASTFFFGIPYRLLWDNFQKFMGEQEDPGDSTDYLIPQLPAPSGGHAELSLADYMGIPTKVNNITTSALWHRAYNLVWNEWFRDQNLQDSLPVPKGDGPDNPADYTLQKRGKRHDYFTSCLPFPQKGPAVNLPLGGEAPVTGIGFGALTGWNTTDDQVFETGGSGSVTYDNWKTGTDAFRVEEDPDNSGYPNIRANLAEATAATINQLREAFQVQRLFERDARGGTRYTELVLSHFGVTSPDSRLQRPEYLGGGTTPIQVNPIAQTSSTDGTTPQGNLAAMGTLNINGHGFVKSFTEHTILIGLVCVYADLNYQQGMDRMWSRRTRFDHYWPSLAHLGEQAVLNKEIFSQGTAVDDEVFGYQERFAEYRYKPSRITGRMRSNAAQPLDVWHLAQDFASLPALNSSFIEEDPPLDRVIAVQTEPQIIWDSYFQMTCTRPMPVYSVPGLIDHF